MDDDTFLRLSRALYALPLADKMNFHAIRYRFFYENSSLGHKCKYAVLTKIAAKQEKETLLRKVREIPDTETVLFLLELL